MISWFASMNTSQCRQDCRIRGSASVAIRRRWKLNQLANTKTHSGLEQYYSLKAFFFVFVQEEGFQVRTALSLFTLKGFLMLFANFLLLICLTCTRPSWTCKDWANCELCKKPVRNSPIRNVHIYPCDSAGYQNELLCTTGVIRRQTILMVQSMHGCNVGYLLSV